MICPNRLLRQPLAGAAVASSVEPEGVLAALVAASLERCGGLEWMGRGPRWFSRHDGGTTSGLPSVWHDSYRQEGRSRMVESNSWADKNRCSGTVQDCPLLAMIRSEIPSTRPTIRTNSILEYSGHPMPRTRAQATIPRGRPRERVHQTWIR